MYKSPSHAHHSFTRITGEFDTLIDNIFSNNHNFSLGVSGNLPVSISDHLPQILIVPKENIKANPIVCLNNFSRKTNEVIDTYLPLVKLPKKELKIQVKPWITSGIRK